MGKNEGETLVFDMNAGIDVKLPNGSTVRRIQKRALNLTVDLYHGCDEVDLAMIGACCAEHVQELCKAVKPEDNFRPEEIVRQAIIKTLQGWELPSNGV